MAWLHGLYELHEFQPRYPTVISKKVLRREPRVIQLMQVMQANAAGSKDLIRSLLVQRCQIAATACKTQEIAGNQNHTGKET
jgi:hypothetical protein